MSRLEELVAVRRQIDAEINRERAAIERTRQLKADALRVTTRATWNERVLAVTCHHYDVKPADVLSARRETVIVDVRHTAMWLMRDAGRSYPEIGAEFDRDHTSAMHGVRRVAADDRLLATAYALREQLTGKPALKVVNAS